MNMVHIIQSKAAKCDFKRFPAILLAALLGFALFAHASSCKMVPGGGIKKELIAACENGDLERVKEIIEQFPQLVNLKYVDHEKGIVEGEHYDNKREHTPLTSSIGATHIDIVAYLLSKGADPNQLSRTIFSNKSKGIFKLGGDSEPAPNAILLAIMDGQVDLLKLLIEYGADINWHSEETSVAQYAVKMCVIEDEFSRKNELPNFDSFGVLKLLIESGTDFTVKTHYSGSNMIYHVVPFNSEQNDNAKKVIIILIDYGLDINAKNAKGKTPLDKAKQSPNKEMVEILKSLGAKE